MIYIQIIKKVLEQKTIKILHGLIQIQITIYLIDIVQI